MPSFPKSLERVVRICAGAAFLLAVLALAGWLFGITLLKTGLVGPVPMNPTSAIAFLLAASALWLMRNGSAPHAKRGRILGVIVASIGAIKLLDYALGVECGIDKLLFAQQLAGNRMAPNTATGLLLTGAALALLDARTGRRFSPGEFLAATVAVLGLLCLVGYALGAKALYGIASCIPMAANAAIALEILAIGMLCARPGRGVVAALVSPNAGGVAARRLLPLAVFLPVVLGWARMEGQHAGYYNAEFGAALMVTMSVVLFVAPLCWTATVLNRADDDRLRAGERLAVLRSNTQRLAQGKDLFAAVGGHDEIAQVDQVFRQTARDLASAHAAVDKQSRLLQSVLDSMGEGVVVADEQGKFLIFNPAAERLLGLGPVDGPSSEWSARYRVFLPDRTSPYPPEDLPLARAIRGEAVDAAEVYVRPPEAAEGRWLDVTGRPFSGADGERGGGVVVFRDTTRTKQAEEDLRSLNEELEQRVEQRTADLAETNRDLAQKNQENETFVYSVSHDLRSPLVNLQGFSQELATVSQEVRGILSQQEVPAQLRERGLALVDNEMIESIGFIQTSVTRLCRIIDALLRLSRAGRVEYQRRPVDVQAIVATVVTSMAGTIDEKGAQVTVGTLPVALGDSTAIEQIFANLIGNALNYLDPARLGSIEIGLDDLASDTGPPHHTYYVRDNGLGIPAAYQPKLFQVFQRLHPEMAKGEGIGLAMVRRIVERHGGKIWVESKEGEGSIFFVKLPACEANGREPESLENVSEQGGQEDDRRAISCIAGGR